MNLNLYKVTAQGKVAVWHMLALAALLAAEILLRLPQSEPPAILGTTIGLLQGILLFPVGFIGFFLLPGPRVGPESPLWIPLTVGSLLVVLNSYLWALVVTRIRQRRTANKPSEATR